MLELALTRATVVLCSASPDAVDTVEAVGDALRVAPDEALLLGPDGSAEALIAAATARSAALDDDAVVLDATDGWTIWTLGGDAARMAFAYLSAIELPDEGFVQGEVARVHAKVVVRGDRVHLLVPAMWSAHLRSRILSDLEPLEVRELTGPQPWPATRRARRGRP